jgi:transketolase
VLLNSASAPAKQVYNKFGLTGDALAERASKAIDYFKKLGQNVYSPVSHSFNI